MHEYFKWRHRFADGAAWMGPLLNVQLSELRAIKTGRPAAHLLSSDISFQMLDAHPEDVTLLDHVYNEDTLALISPRVQAFLRDEAIADVELIPVTLLDHRGQVASMDYAIAHPVRVVDCVDQEKSQFEWNALDSQNMSAIDLLVLDPDKLGPDDRLIRPRYVVNTILVRDDLAQRLLQQKFSGLYMLPLDE